MRLGIARSENMRGIADGGQWVAQLVSEHRQELVLLAIGVPERLLCLLLVLDVGTGAEPLHDVVLVIANRRPPGFEPVVFAVKSANSILQVVGSAVLDGLPPSRECPLLIVGMYDQTKPLQSELLRFGNTRVLHPLLAQKVTLAIGEADKEELLHVVGERSEFLLAQPDHGGLPLMLGDQPPHLILAAPIAD